MLIVFLILLLLFGIYILTYDYMKDLYAEAGRIISKTRESFRGTDITKKGKLWERIRLTLGVSLGMGTDRAVRAFIVISLMMAVPVILMTGGRISLFLALSASATAALSPYVLLRIRMEKIRMRSSHEGEIFLSELTENYKLNYYNMKEAIERTAISMDEAPDTRRILMNLSRGLGRAGSEESINRLLNEFSLSISTSWAKTLKNLMYFSLVHGIRVEEAMEDLSITIRKAREAEEYARRENNEANMMIRYLIPLSYLLTVLGGVRFFGLGWDKFLHYQFGTGVGMTWFTISLLIYIISYMVNLFLSESKLDL